MWPDYASLHFYILLTRSKWTLNNPSITSVATDSVEGSILTADCPVVQVLFPEADLTLPLPPLWQPSNVNTEQETCKGEADCVELLRERLTLV